MKKMFAIFGVILTLISVITPLCVSAVNYDCSDLELVYNLTDSFDDSIDSQSIIDLTNTTWYIPSGWSATAGYGSFDIEGIHVRDADIIPTVDVGVTFSGFKIGYWLDYETEDFFAADDYATVGGDTFGFSSNFTLYITGGIDTTNTALISWLTTYGIQLKVTDLTDTTWNVPAGWEAEAGYGKFLDIGGSGLRIDGDLLNPITFYAIAIGYSYYSTNSNKITFAPHALLDDGSYYANNYSFELNFTGGTDATNPKLIAWLSKYGELVEDNTVVDEYLNNFMVWRFSSSGVITRSWGYSLAGTITVDDANGTNSYILVDDVINVIFGKLYVYDVLTQSGELVDGDGVTFYAYKGPSSSPGYYSFSTSSFVDNIVTINIDGGDDYFDLLLLDELYNYGVLLRAGGIDTLDMIEFRSYNDGYAVGLDEALAEYDKGFDDGYEVGYNDGYAVGLDEALAEYDKGFDDGYEVGYNEAASKDLGNNLLGSTLSAPMTALNSFILYQNGNTTITLGIVVGSMLALLLLIAFLKLFAGG